MRKIICGIISVLLVFSLFACAKEEESETIKDSPIIFNRETQKPEENGDVVTPSPEPPAEPIFTGNAVCILDAATGDVVYGTKENDKYYIASITKLITALVALDYLNENDTLTVKSGWIEITNKDWTINQQGYKTGNRCVVKDLLKLMLVKSFGDCAEILAGATEEASGIDFITLMNEKAEELGLAHTSFDNVIGLDMGNGFMDNYSTAAETAKLLIAAMKNETIKAICSDKTVVLTNGTKIENANLFIKNGSGYDNFSVVGGKNGSTNLAGNTEAILFRDNATGKEYAACYLGGKSASTLKSELTYIMDYVLRTAE